MAEARKHASMHPDGTPGPGPMTLEEAYSAGMLLVSKNGRWMKPLQKTRKDGGVYYGCVFISPVTARKKAVAPPAKKVSPAKSAAPPTKKAAAPAKKKTKRSSPQNTAKGGQGGESPPQSGGRGWLW